MAQQEQTLLDHWGLLWPVFAFLATQLVGAIVLIAKIYTRLEVLESTVKTNKILANGLSEHMKEIDEHGSRNVPLLNERLINEHVRIDTLSARIDDIGKKLDASSARLEELAARHNHNT